MQMSVRGREIRINIIIPVERLCRVDTVVGMYRACGYIVLVWIAGFRVKRHIYIYIYIYKEEGTYL